jgi:hypothetical protein
MGISGITSAQGFALQIKSVRRVATTLQQKIQRLKQLPSADPIQQLQTDAIIDLYDVVVQIEQAIGMIPTLVLPDVSAARNAAAAQAAMQRVKINR